MNTMSNTYAQGPVQKAGPNSTHQYRPRVGRQRARERLLTRAVLRITGFTSWVPVANDEQRQLINQALGSRVCAGRIPLSGLAKKSCGRRSQWCPPTVKRYSPAPCLRSS